MLKIFIRGCSSAFRIKIGPRWKGPAILAIAGFVATITQAQTATEYQVKAAFLFNFAKFVDWPAEAFPGADSPLQICVLGQDPFGHEFQDVIADKTINGRRIEVIHPSGVPQARACHIIFVSSSEKRQMRAILRGLQGPSILTVADTEGFAGMGGIINFVLDN